METRAAIAERLRQRFGWLQSFTDEELREISMCAEEGPLLKGEEYFDLSHPEQGSIQARENEYVPEGSCYVARSALSDETWRKLVEESRKR